MSTPTDYAIQRAQQCGYEVERFEIALTPAQFSPAFKVTKAQSVARLTELAFQAWASSGCTENDLQMLKISGVFIPTLQP
jgi:hypothetical protein